MQRKEIKSHNFVAQQSDDLCFVLCIGPDSFFNHLEELNDALKDIEVRDTVTVVLDQILITCDGEQRFIETHLTNGKILLKNLRTIEGTDFLRMTSSKICLQHWSSIVPCSILTMDQRLRVASKAPL